MLLAAAYRRANDRVLEPLLGPPPYLEEHMTDQMAGKVALVTGGSSGIGRAAALAFAAEGARVAIASRTRATGEEAVRAIAQNGGEAIWIEADVSRAGQVAAMVERVVETYGRLDYAFNNAGGGRRGGPIVDIEEAEWNRTIDVYLKSVWLCMKYEIPELLKAGGGAIVNNSSVDGERAFPMDPVYSAAKHGVLGLTRSASAQYADQGIRINAVCPAWIEIPRILEIMKSDPDAQAELEFHQPIGRLGKPEEVGQAVIWLCSDSASFIVGAALPVDGGYLVV